jgi:hypothetical protein
MLASSAALKLAIVTIFVLAPSNLMMLVNLLKAMMMAKEAWNIVTSTTIEHCWDHTAIQL